MFRQRWIGPIPARVKTTDVQSTTVNGLLISQNSTTVAEPTTFLYDAVERRIGVQDPRHSSASQIDYYTGSMQVFQQIDAAGNATILFTIVTMP